MTTRPRLLLAALAALASLLLAATPASAHGKKVLISLEATPSGQVGGDGGTAAITAKVSYDGDGHPARGVTLRTAAVSGTRQVPVRLAPASAPGTYTGGARLAPGTWEIRTEATGDHTGTAVTELTVATPTTTTQPPATPTPAEPAAAPPAEPAAAEGSGLNPALVLVPVGLVAIGAAVLALRRTRRT